MDIFNLILIALVVALIYYFTVGKKKRLQRRLRRAEQLERQQRYLDALEEYLDAGLDYATEFIIRAPMEFQTLLHQHIRKYVKPSELRSSFLKLAKKFQYRRDIASAATAYLFAGYPKRALDLYIAAGGPYLTAAIQIIDKYPNLFPNKEQIVRSYARQAYEHGKYLDAAELLRLIGHDEEADAVLVAASNILRQQGRIHEANRFEEEVSNPETLLKKELTEAERLLKSGNLEKLQQMIGKLNALYYKFQEKHPHSAEKQIYKEKKKKIERFLRLLNTARMFLKQKFFDQAKALYEELLETFGEDNLSASILAEAALAFEEKDPRESARLYNLAAQKTTSPEAKRRFLEYARRQIEIATHGTPLPTTTAVSTDKDVRLATISENIAREERCSVCRRPFRANETIVRCPKCNSPAHYGHLAEWVKIRGFCPICKQKISVPPPPKATAQF